MSLHYIVDGCNVLHHPLIAALAKRKQGGAHRALLEFLQLEKPWGSSRNEICVVFDGYPPAGLNPSHSPKAIELAFSRGISADEIIKKMVDKTSFARNTVVVSDDRELGFFIRAAGAKVMAVEDFINRAKGLSACEKSIARRRDSLKTELNYTEVARINKELKQAWLK